MRAFHDRETPLQVLRERAAADTAEMIVFYGRRRIGKTALLRYFAAEQPTVFYLASRVAEADQLATFKQAIADTFDLPFVDALHLDSWETALRTVRQCVGDQRVVVVLDEFQYLCEVNPALPSIIQRWWDLEGKDSPMMLLLCGSHISFMEQEVLAERSPLFGRRTGQILLEPLLPWDIAGFIPSWTPLERFRAYGILGGVPAYLERIGNDSLTDYLRRDALRTDGYLFDEVPFLLRTELGQHHTVLSLLKAMSAGATRMSDIAGKAGLAASSVSHPLRILIELGLVERRAPFTEKNPHHSKRGRYFIKDPFVRFWCRFILPYQGLIASGRGELAWTRYLEPALSTYLGPVFEDAAHLYVKHRIASKVPGEHALRTGRQWGRDFDLDLVAELTDGSLLVGECKARARPADVDLLGPLRERAARLAPDARLAIFSLSGFTEALSAHDEVILVDGGEIFGHP